MARGFITVKKSDETLIASQVPAVISNEIYTEGSTLESLETTIISERTRQFKISRQPPLDTEIDIGSLIEYGDISYAVIRRSDTSSRRMTLTGVNRI